MTWQYDPSHTSIQFAVRHMMVSNVRGAFTDVDVDVKVDEQDLTNSKATFTFDAASVETGEKDRDGHLRSADFFNAEKYPKITFQTKRIEPKGDNEYRFVGDLTIRDVTREIALDGEVHGPFEDPWGGSRIALNAEGKVNRKEFGLEWNVPLKLGGVMVGDDVKLSLDTELVKAA